MKCINCYREIGNNLKFCTYCGTKQPEDRKAYELEHPELADALPEEERAAREAEAAARAAREEARAAAEAQAQAATAPPIVDDDDDDLLLPYGDDTQAQPTEPVFDEEPPTVPAPAAPLGNGLVMCPNCGHPISSRAEQCPHCGYNVNGSNVVPVTTPTLPAPPAPPEPPTDDSPTLVAVNPAANKSGGSGKGLIAFLAVIAIALAGVLGYFLWQKFNPQVTYFDPAVTSLSFDREGGSKGVTINTDAEDYEINTSQGWITATQDADGDLVVRVDATNETGLNERTGTITLTAGDFTKVIDVSQRMQATYLKLSKESVSAGMGGEDFEIEIDSDGGGFQIEKPDWCDIGDQTNKGFTVTVNGNGGAHRNGEVKVTDGNLEAILKISQKGTCTTCGGDGWARCSRCGGDGSVYVDMYWDDWYEEWEGGYYVSCSSCGGNGTKKCSKCGGSGVR